MISDRGEASVFMSYYHIYNRGAHKAPIFQDKGDYERMIKLLYIANCSEPFVLRSLGEKNIFEIPRKDTLVDIVVYCLMPNHIHIAVRLDEQRPRLCISRFIHKLCTAYSGYFNRKYDHSGTIWQGPYKDKVTDDELYIRTLISYIHLNPYALKEPGLTKEARAEHIGEALACAREYRYSSMRDYCGEKRPQFSILSKAEFDRWVTTEASPLHVEPSPSHPLAT